MGRVPDFYSINEDRRPSEFRVYHNNDACLIGRDVTTYESLLGSNGYTLCDHCEMLNLAQELTKD